MVHAVIMAGGSGTRFWPASRRRRPKQFLSFGGGAPLLRRTFERIAPLVDPERIWVVTAEATAAASRELLPELPPANVLGEPAARDTAACVGWACRTIAATDPGAVCVVLPADHVIGDEERLREALATGVRHVEVEGGLLTFGIRPTRPETGYGYLKLGPVERRMGQLTVHILERFVEKPDAATARDYLASHRYLWNSGMFAWRASDLLDEIRRQLPLLAEGLEALAADPSAAGRIYPALPRTSVDYGIMEGARRVWTIPVDFPWSDVGSWPALAEILPADG
ncbi:MAG TPA: mannose-1-phosphate guanylyltransferase, partial [Acidobacteria bacterium]|nr:mannose-1-phosphate guanylyltransferase [Acidobacteriota bacterium]